MFPLISKVAAVVLMSASTFTNPSIPSTPKALSFDASAYVTVNNQIRIAVQKIANVPAVVLLRDKNNEILFRQNISKKESAYAVKLDVTQLADGQYELEVKSNEGSIRKQLNLATAPVQKAARIVAVQ